MIKYRIKEIISSVVINCHLHGEIEDISNKILRYKPGVNFTTLRTVYHCDGILINFASCMVFTAALSGVPCSMEYRFRENELICSEENLS